MAYQGGLTPKEILFIGGTGLISSACVRRAVDLGHHVTVLNRGSVRAVPIDSRALPAEATVLTADVLDAIDAIVPPGVDLAAHEKFDTPPALLEPALRRR